MGSVRKVVGSSSSGVSSDLSDPDSDGGHDDDRNECIPAQEANNDIESRKNTQAFIKKHGNMRKKENIMVEISTQTKEIMLQKSESGLQSELEEWEIRYKSLQEKNRLLLEEKCELEEAENDSRLQAQR